MNIKEVLPWQAKIAAKVLLSRMPFDYRFWQRLGLFKHGSMEHPEYAHDVFVTHFRRVDFPGKADGFTALEIGPGDTLFSAMIARAYGAAQCYLVDVGRFARNDVAPYLAMEEWLSRRGLVVPTVKCATSLNEVLAVCGATYLADGVSSLRSLPDQSVDFVWSQAVLEHIRRAEFLPMMREVRRVLRPDGVCSHRVDLKDHLGGALNNLRFSAKVWESNFMACSGFYTNRIRYKEMLSFFEAAGFQVDVCQMDRWNNLPTPRSKLSLDFRTLTEDDLCVSGFDVILRAR